MFFLLPKLPAFANVIDLSGPPVTEAVVERSLRLTEERIDRYIASGPNFSIRTHVRIPTFQEFLHKLATAASQPPPPQNAFLLIGCQSLLVRARSSPPHVLN